MGRGRGRRRRPLPAFRSPRQEGPRRPHAGQRERRFHRPDSRPEPTFPYHDADWQAAAKHYAIAHIYDTLAANAADAEAKARITVECFAVSPLVPLNTNIYLQEAKGLAIALHIKGVQFEEDETDGFGLTLAVPIPLKAILLTGEVEADQLTPTTGMVAFRIRAKGLKSPFKTQQGKWLAPILVEEQIAAAASSNGTAPKFDNLRTHLRRMGRNATKRELAAGSAAGCAVAYTLWITDLDPIEYDLLFERFLNPSRVSMPDIDMDFDTRYRDNMIRYAADMYGRDCVAQVMTFSQIKARAAVRDAARVLGYPYSVGDKVAKAMPPLIMGRDSHHCAGTIVH